MPQIPLGIPGFIDLQLNGFRQINFSDPELAPADARRVCREILETGTAAFLPTLVTGSVQMYERNLALFADIMEEPEFRGHLLGMHVEGPFISPEPGAVGAHPVEHVRPPDPELLARMHDWANGKISILTIAADQPGAAELCRAAVELGITVTLAHQLASSEDLARLVDAGATALTHLGNGMPNTINRHENVLLSALAEDGLSATLITDGHHLPPELIKVALRTKGVGRSIVVSDASPLAGLEPGHYHAFGLEVVMEESGRLFNPERQCLVGSSAMMMDCMNFLASLDLLEQPDLLDVAFYNPLRLIDVAPADLRARGVLSYDSEARCFAFDAGANQ